jgi:hypothetical protein
MFAFCGMRQDDVSAMQCVGTADVDILPRCYAYADLHSTPQANWLHLSCCTLHGCLLPMPHTQELAGKPVTSIIAKQAERIDG